MSRTLVILALLALASAARAQPTAALPCAAEHQVLVGSRLHLACGPRLVILDLATGRVVADETLDEPIRGLHDAGERVWVELGEGRAQLAPGAGAPSSPVEAPEPSVESGAAVSAPTEAPSAEESAPEESAPEASAPEPIEPVPSPPAGAVPRGRVLAVEDDEVLIDLGRRDGIDVGQRIDVTPADQEGQWLDDDNAIVGRVEKVSEDRARVRIRWGQTTEEGAPAVLTENGEVGSLVAPPTPPRGLSMRGALLAGLPIDDLGIQALVEGELTYRGGRFFMARARLRPSGLSIGQGADFGSAGGYAQLGFDHRLVGAAFGVGVERVFDDDGGSFSPKVAFPTSFRVGAVDGLMLEVTTLLTIDDGELDILSIDGLAQMPLAGGVWLQVRGGGGIATTFWHAEAMVRLALQGNGQSGTTTLEIGVGALGTTWRRAPGDRLGPSLIVGVGHRM
jgi:hypothetical protein